MVYYGLLCNVFCGHPYAIVGPKVLSMSLIELSDVLGGNLLEVNLCVLMD